MKILITGGAGYIGSHFLKEIKKSNKFHCKNVLTIDNLYSGNKKNIIFGNFIKADLKNKNRIEKIIKKFKPDLIVHFAALISVPESVKKPLKYYKNNFIGTLNLINAALKNNVKKFIFSSSAAVYGVPTKTPTKEDSELNPINPYGNSKKMIEDLLRDITKSRPDFHYVCLRYFNVAGNDPELEVGNRQKCVQNLIPIILNKIKNKKYEIGVFGHNYNTFDKTCVRDYIHVVDIARAHLEVIPLLNKSSYTFNVGYNKGVSVLQIINTIENNLNIKLKINFKPRRVGDPEKLIANNNLIKKMTAWKPLYDDLNIIINTAWEWTKKNN